MRHHSLQPGGVHGRADLHGDGIGDATEVLDMRAIELRRAHADPREVRREVVPAVLSRNETGLRLLIQQMQTLVTGVETHQARILYRLAAHAFEEIERIADRIDDALVGILQR